MNDSEILHYISKASIFGALSPSSIEYLLALSKHVSLENNQYLFREGDSGDTIFLIYKGRIAIKKTDSNHASVEVVRLGCGDALGEMSIFDMNPRSASAQSVGEASLLSWQSTDLLGLYQKDLEQFALLQMNIGREISRRLRRMDEQYSKMIAKHPSIVE